MKENPTISIITIVYNRYFDIEYTLKSVLDQSYPNKEIIVIDGGSNDGTEVILETYQSKIDVLISEKDHGIYDAMNKGLKNASGDYVIFMNGGDCFYNSETLSNIFLSNAFKNQDLIFGDTMLINSERKEKGLLSKIGQTSLPSSIDKSTFKFGPNICHQSFIILRKIAPNFDTKYSLVADLKWMITCMDSCKSFLKFQFPISQFLSGGISQIQKRKSLWQRFLLYLTIYGPFSTLISHLLMLKDKIKKTFRSSTNYED